MFCTYLITYMGNKMPMFYIGSTSISKIHKGYLGSVSSIMYKDIWNNEITNNRHLFKIRIVSLHLDRLSAYNKEEELQRRLKVMNNLLYVNRSYAITGRDISGANNPMKNSITAKKVSNTKKLLNKPAHNKGVPNDAQRDKMISDNPMKKIETVLKMTETRLKNNNGIDPVKNTIWIANVITKVRRRVSIKEFETLDSTWIKLSNRSLIPNQEQATHSS